jgi:enoyl-CoA hydratase/carnithine racemase
MIAPMAEILTDRAGAVCRLQINRPEKKNALTGTMYEALADALKGAEADRAIRAIVIHGAGDAFTAGNDLRDFLERPPSGPESPTFRFMAALAGASKPVVAAVHGVAVGIGTTLLLHCELVYAAEGARFSLPFVDLGLVPEFGSSVLLPSLAGYHRAAEYLLLGKPFDAQAARDIGLVNAVVPADQLLPTAMAAAQALAEKPAAAVRLAKTLMRRGRVAIVETAMHDEGRLFAERLASPEAREAFTAFLGKRKPDFSQFD